METLGFHAQHLPEIVSPKHLPPKPMNLKWNGKKHPCRIQFPIETGDLSIHLWMFWHVSGPWNAAIETPACAVTGLSDFKPWTWHIAGRLIMWAQGIWGPWGVGKCCRKYCGIHPLCHKATMTGELIFGFTTWVWIRSIQTDTQPVGHRIQEVPCYITMQKPPVASSASHIAWHFPIVWLFSGPKEKMTGSTAIALPQG